MACIHDNPIFEILAPTMDVARIPIEEMGHRAVNILLNDIKNKTGIGEKNGYEISLSKDISE
jgi:DNA-binding LacI/PurR family transcriptional regulator